MTSSPRRARIAALLLLVVVAAPSPAAVVVERTAPEAAQLLRPGDVLAGWRRGPASSPAAAGTFATPFDLLDVTLEQAPLGMVTLLGERGGAPLAVAVALETAGVGVRPRLGPEALAAVTAALEAARRGEPGAVATAAAGLAPADAAWLALRAAELMAEAGDREAAAASAAGAAAAAEGVLPPHHSAHLWDRVGDLRLGLGDPPGGGAAHGRALELRRGRPLAEARSHLALGRVAAAGDDHPGAERAFRAAVELRSAHAPDSLSEGMARNNLAVALWQQEKLREAGEELERALAIKRALAPGTSSEAATLVNLGLLAGRRGDLEAAEGFYRQALALRERLEPETMAHGLVLTNLGNLLADRGEFDAAEELLRRALAITRRERPGGRDEAVDLGNLALVAFDRGDPARAESLLREQLALLEGMDPAPPGEVARCLANLGELAVLVGRLDEAAERLGRAVPLARAQGETVHLAHALECRGDLELARSDGAAAASAFREALAIVRRTAPGSLAEARLLSGLGEVARLAGDLAGELTHLEAAVAALEAQVARLGGTQDVRSGFRARRVELYQRLQEVLVELGRPEAAFAVRERARARWLLELLAERDLQLGRGAAAELDHERARLGRDHDRLSARAAALAPHDPAAAAALRGELAALVRRQAEVREELRRAAPGLAAVRYPRPLDAAAARALLAPGQAALAYSVGAERTLLYVLERDRPLAVRVLPCGEEELRRRVGWLRALVEAGPQGGSAAALERAARELERLLLAPAAAATARSARLLVLPDGPLQVLPFALLADGDGRLLVERHALSRVASMTVLGELRRGAVAAAGAAPAARVVFADPRHPGGGDTTAASHRGAMAPLPAARAEAAAVATRAERSTVLLGERASERAAKQVSGPLQALHFAAHVRLDEHLPLGSGILLAADPPGAGRENGVLQAWEVLEGMRVQTELVVLSGCSSGLGRERAGEGLLGLVRAFQLAGARGVLASSWRVDDASTARLMQRFYRHLDAGLAADLALQRAQLDVLDGGGVLGRMAAALGLAPARPHPALWAAFVLDGDVSGGLPPG